MSSIQTNNGAMNALATMRNVNRQSSENQTRISTGLKVRSGKENAAYFSISNTMKGDSGMFKSINEGMTLTKNSVATAKLGAETVKNLTKEFTERVSFSQGQGINRGEVQKELDELVGRMDTIIKQSTFNGDNLVNGTSTVTVVTGVSRSSGSFQTTTFTFQKVDLGAIKTTLQGIDLNAASTTTLRQAALTTAETALASAISSATNLGIAEKSIETQQSFLADLTDEIDGGVGAMVDANMEEEAAKMQSLQVQQQLAVQGLSIANQAPQSIMGLFR